MYHYLKIEKYLNNLNSIPMILIKLNSNKFNLFMDKILYNIYYLIIRMMKKCSI